MSQLTRYALLLCAALPALGGPAARAAAPLQVDLTWMSIANVYIEAGAVKAVFDGYITRLPQAAFHGGGGGYAYTTRP